MSQLHELKGWHSRGYLPHCDGGDIPQAVSFRLTDLLPGSKLEDWRAELSDLPDDRAAEEFRERVERYLDLGRGEAWLRQPSIAILVQGALLHFDGARCRLHAWVVMPNHVHTLFTPMGERSLSEILHSWKSFTSKHANRVLGRQGQFWQEDYFDSYIRDDLHYAAVVEYIESNPVKAGLCSCPEDWPYSSASVRR